MQHETTQCSVTVMKMNINFQGLEYEKEGRSLEDLENYLKEAVFIDEDSQKDEL